MTHASMMMEPLQKKAIDPNSFGAGEVVTPASLPVPPEEKSLSILEVSIRQWR
jgi:hypothetical protein